MYLPRLLDLDLDAGLPLGLDQDLDLDRDLDLDLDGASYSGDCEYLNTNKVDGKISTTIQEIFLTLGYELHKVKFMHIN